MPPRQPYGVDADVERAYRGYVERGRDVRGTLVFAVNVHVSNQAGVLDRTHVCSLL